MRSIMERHQLKHFVQQMFPCPMGAEQVNLLFYHPADTEEYEKIRAASEEMMDTALRMGGAPYTKGRQWSPYLEKHLGNTGYWRTLKAIKNALDPNHIMNPGAVGL